MLKLAGRRVSTNRWASRSDEELIAGLAARDERAVEVLLSRHWASAWRVARQLTGDAASAEDVAQEALVRVLQAAPRFAPGAAFRPWLFTIVRNAAKDQVKREQRRAAHEAGAPARRAESEDEVMRDEVATVVRAELERLKPEQREVVSLHYLAGLTLQEIASVLGCPFGTVSSRLGRGLTALKKALPAGVAVGAGVIASAAGEASAAPSAATLLARAGAGPAASAPDATATAVPPARTATKLSGPAALVTATVVAAALALGALLAPDQPPPPVARGSNVAADGPAPAGRAPADLQDPATPADDAKDDGQGGPPLAGPGDDAADDEGMTDDGEEEGDGEEDEDEDEDRVAVRGRVTFQGAPWPHARINRDAYADADGRFEVELERDGDLSLTLGPRGNAGLPDGAHDLLSDDPVMLRRSGGTEETESLDVAELSGGDLELQLVPVTFSGRVVTANGGAPVEGAHVLAAGGVVRTDGEGRFELTVPRVDRGQLVVMHPDLAPALFMGNEPSQGRVDGLVLRVERAVTVDVQVLDPAGQPAAGARVDVQDELLVTHAANAGYPRERRDRRLVADAQGRVRLDGLHPALTLAIGRATVRLRVNHEGYPELAGQFVVDGREPLVLQLVRTHEVRGRVTRTAGAPVQGAVVLAVGRGERVERFRHLRDPGYQDWIAGLEGAVKTDAEGRFTLSLPRGAQRLLVHGPGLADQVVAVDVAAQDVAITLGPATGRLSGRVTGGALGLKMFAFAPGVREVALGVVPVELDGTFALGGLAPDGRYDLELRQGWDGDLLAEVEGAQVGTPVELAGPTNWGATKDLLIYLTALAAESGEKLRDAYFQPVDGTAVVTSSNGAYLTRFADVGAGIHVGAPGRRPIVLRAFDPQHDAPRRYRRFTAALEGGAGRAEVAVDAGDLAPERALVEWRDPGTGATFRAPLSPRGGRLRGVLDGITPGVCDVRVELWEAGATAPRVASTVLTVREGQTASAELTVR